MYSPSLAISDKHLALEKTLFNDTPALCMGRYIIIIIKQHSV